MARYEDYAKGSLDQEIEEAGEGQEARSNVPSSVLSRFEGKSVEDILASYAELEKAYSKQGNKMGELRKSFDDYVLLQSQKPAEPEVPEEPITSDELYDNPEVAVSKIVERKTKDRLAKLEEELYKAKLQTAQERFEAKYPDVQKIVTDPAFVNWVQEKPHRMRLAQAANQYDFDAAEELFGLYEDSRPRKQTKQNRRQAVASAALESTNAEPAQLDEVVSRSLIVQAKLAAKRGDREAEQWLRQNAEAIAIAYEEGRIVD